MITIYGPDVLKNELELFQNVFKIFIAKHNKIIIHIFIYRNFHTFVIETLTYIYEVGKIIRGLKRLFDHSYKEYWLVCLM